jgi:diguanylate cyclase (GGDEF)-like protein
MLIGIDHLARINDAFGFDVADAVISEVAARIRMRLRGGDVLGRFSGNKFGLILKNCTVDDMNVAAERFLAGIRDEVVPTRSGPVSVTASIGAVSCATRNADEAINRPRNPRPVEAPPRRIVFAMASQRRARCPAPGQYPRHRRNRHRAQ